MRHTLRSPWACLSSSPSGYFSTLRHLHIGGISGAHRNRAASPRPPTPPSKPPRPPGSSQMRRTCESRGRRAEPTALPSTCITVHRRTADYPVVTTRCLAWRATAGCSHLGNREPHNDMDCTAAIHAWMSGAHPIPSNAIPGTNPPQKRPSTPPSNAGDVC